jgi:hypothetical protein
MSLKAPVIPPAVLRAFTSGLGNYIDPSVPLWSLMQKEHVALAWWSLSLFRFDPSQDAPDAITDDHLISTGWRFVASDGNLYGECHVGSAKPGAPPILTGCSYDSQIPAFMESLKALKALPVIGTGEFELRGLSSRWLHFEAFWLHTKDGKGDIVIPYAGFVEGPPNRLERMRPYPAKDFLNAIWPCVRKAAADLKPAVIAQRRLTFRIQNQRQSEWCWAAVAASVQQFFEPASDPGSELSQCEVASMVLQKKETECCDDPEPCNKAEKLETALKKIHKWRNTLKEDPSTEATGSLTFEQVQREIDRGRPVCAGITWESGGRHFVIVRGYRELASGAHQVDIADPLNPSNLVDFDEFTTAYYGEGKWTSTDLVVKDWS